MKTKIYKNYSEFINRKDRKENGVSESFAKNNPNFEDDNKTNISCWNCSRCSRCSGCSYCSCCSDCSRCSGCSCCSDCFDCFDKKDTKGKIKASKVKDLNKKVLTAISGDESLNMDTWHTCDTTHCWAGWIVHLAGDDGYELEKETSTLFAAMMIYKKSNGKSISPCYFFLPNEEARVKITELANI